MMYFLQTFILSIVAALFTTAACAAPASHNPGTISSPAPGTVIAPGASFDFQYNTRADYGVSSYNYTVFLLTSLPTSFSASAEVADGHFFGRFGFPNYPGNPSPHNLAPTQLVMPDFSQSPGGFGAGAAGVNAPFYLVVIEEYSNGQPTMGDKLGLAITPIVYNATASSS